MLENLLNNVRTHLGRTKQGDQVHSVKYRDKARRPSRWQWLGSFAYIYIYIPRAHTRCVLYTVEFNQISPFGGLILLESEPWEG